MKIILIMILVFYCKKVEFGRAVFVMKGDKMSSRAFILIIVSLIALNLGAATTAPFDYNSAWDEIRNLQNKGLPQSMATKVDSLYEIAILENNIDQQIKALIYQLAILKSREEFSQQKGINKVKEQLGSAEEPLASILHSMLGQLYWNYYVSNRYRIGQRTELVDNTTEDIATWDLKTITKETIKEYQLSLTNAEVLQNIKLADLPSIVNAGGKAERLLRPTLYDFLAQIALTFFKNEESGLTLPFEGFSLSEARYLSAAADFSKLNIATSDSLSLKFVASKLFQDLISFHLSDADPQALIEVDLDRLAYVYSKSKSNDREQLYELALRSLAKAYEGDPASAYVSYFIACLYRTWGDKYDSAVSEEYRWGYRDTIQICQAAIDKYPNSYGATCCQALAEELRAPVLELSVEEYNLPNTHFKALVRMSNLSGVKLRVYRIPYTQMLESNYGRGYYRNLSLTDEQLQTYLKQVAVRTQAFPISNEGDLRDRTYELPISGLTKGLYLLIASNSGDDNIDEGKILGFTTFSCTEIAYVTSNANTGVMLLLNRQTGKPIPNVQVKEYGYSRNKKDSKISETLVWSGKSDQDGMISIPPNKDNRGTSVFFTSGADSLIIGNFNSRAGYYHQEIHNRSLLFTDRAIYRPGQTVHVKGVIYEADFQKHYKLLPNQETMLVFRDANWTELATKRVLSSEFGTFDASFTIPKNVLLGELTIETYAGSVSFNVEEYKRPRFEVTLSKPTDTYKLGQEVSLKGTALSYSGLPVDNAQVSYRITLEPVYPRWYWWWGIRPATQEKEIKQGRAVTNEKGEFTLDFTALGDSDGLSAYNHYYSFKIKVDVTDISGETRSGSLALNIGEKELLLDPEVPDHVDLSTGKFTIPITTTNLGGSHISAAGQITISRLQTPDRVLRSRIWAAPDRQYMSESWHNALFPNDIFINEDQINKWKVTKVVFTGKFDSSTADSLSIAGFSDWTPGAYSLEAISVFKGQEVKETRYFTVYDARVSSLPYLLADWFVPVKVVCEPKETAQILIGSGYSEVSYLFEVEKDYEIVSQERFVLNKEQRLLSIPVTEADRGGFYVHVTFVYNGRLYSHTQEIAVPWTNKEIEFEYMSFRDKLLPGQNEEWRLKLKDHTGGKLTAELLASMYDASLDAFRPSHWDTNIFGKVSRYRGWRNTPLTGQMQLNLLRYYKAKHRLSYRSYDSFNWYYYSVYQQSSPFPPGLGNRKSISRSIRSENLAMSDAVCGGVVSLEAEQDIVESAPNASEPELSAVQPRTNFAETAFFYPKLLTDENGEVSIAFTVPESLTKWKFRALALTKDFQIGTTENSAVTQKPLMVMPNAPRFFREGDKIIFQTKISSMDEAEHVGVCQLFLFDAITMNPIDAEFKISEAQQPFRVKKGESTVVSWDLDIPFGISAVTYRVMAESGDFSDGEENTLPILSNRMLVTESLPLPVSGNSTKAFVFDKLLNSEQSSTLTNHKLTLEYTSNPAWYAVQALPYLMEYPYECNEQIFSRLYANALASHIANANPRVKRVFDSWKSTPGSQALLSNLEKNEELKAVLLQETPWVRDALSESQSKQRIGLLFDLNNMANQFDSAVARLKKNQSASGGWPWFPGGNDSWWITQYIVEGFGHLDHLEVRSVRENSQIWQMLQSAVSFMDSEILKDYQNIIKHADPELDHLGYMQMHYLYARSFFLDIPILQETQIAVDYFRAQADQYWLSKDIYGQGLIALARRRDKNKKTPDLIIASLTERALHDEEMGMWWKDVRYGWFWYQAPIETQALLIEAFHELTGNTGLVDEMRTWLLKQKQTTNWKTTKATAEACYALLLNGSEWLNTEELVSIKIGELTIDPMQMQEITPEAGTGYFKTSWTGSEIEPALANIKVTNPNPVAAWGAAYWQYFEDLDKITMAETPLRLKKQLFRERNTETGKVLDSLSEKTQLQIGDKVIVRIELRTDRDLEYVHMKDMRSAGFEPLNVLSHYKRQDGLGYYESTGDAATNFFIDYLRKGTYVFEYPLRVFNKGDFSNGITTIQCMYAPEFTSHSEGIRVKVE